MKNGVREGTNESTRVVNSRRRDEISIDPPRGSETPKRGRASERKSEKKEKEEGMKEGKKEGLLISGFSKQWRCDIRLI